MDHTLASKQCTNMEGELYVPNSKEESTFVANYIGGRYEVSSTTGLSYYWPLIGAKQVGTLSFNFISILLHGIFSVSSGTAQLHLTVSLLPLKVCASDCHPLIETGHD